MDAGEASAVTAARALSGCVVSDDGDAIAIGGALLGPSNVVGTREILCFAVEHGHLTAAQAEVHLASFISGGAYVPDADSGFFGAASAVGGPGGRRALRLRMTSAKRRPQLLAQALEEGLVVDLASVGHPNDEDDKTIVEDLVEDPVVGNADTMDPLLRCTRQNVETFRAGVRLEVVDRVADGSLGLARKILELPKG